MAPDGTLWMLDRYGYAHTARRAAGGAYELLDSPVAYVGPGRPLGFHFDSSGDLIICDSLKARGWAGRAGGRAAGGGGGRPRAGRAAGLRDTLRDGAAQGLTLLERGTHRLRVLANCVRGEGGTLSPITYANDLDLAADGRVRA